MDNLQTNSGEQISEQQPSGPQLSQEKFDQYVASLKREQNLPMAILVGLIASLIGAALWAVITIAAEYQIGFMAVGVGLLVGFCVRSAGKGIDKSYGIIGAVLSIFGCLLGNYLTVIGMIGKYTGLGFTTTFTTIDMGSIPSLMSETFQPIDILFYGIAVYEGYKFSFRRITEQEILQNAAV